MEYTHIPNEFFLIFAYLIVLVHLLQAQIYCCEDNCSVETTLQSKAP